MTDRTCINWLQHTTQSLKTQIPELSHAPGTADRVAQNLSHLLLERLPSQSADLLTGYLPDEHFLLPPVAQRQDELLGLGFSDFVTRAFDTLKLTRLKQEDANLNQFATRCANAFLWAIAQDLPAEFKNELSRHLPPEIKSRMDLNSSHSEDARVA